MKCPKCDGKVRTMDCVNSRHNEVYRRRKCTECDHVFFTCECVVKCDAEFKDEWNLSHRQSYTKKGRKKKNEV